MGVIGGCFGVYEFFVDIVVFGWILILLLEVVNEVVIYEEGGIKGCFL